jgi:hypothetical protein
MKIKIYKILLATPILFIFSCAKGPIVNTNDMALFQASQQAIESYLASNSLKLIEFQNAVMLLKLENMDVDNPSELTPSIQKAFTGKNADEIIQDAENLVKLANLNS